MPKKKTVLIHSYKDRIILLGSVFVVASCGIVYELVAGAVSSYILGDAVTQFSLVIGVFLCAMGVGSYLAKYITHTILKRFIDIEIVIGVVGGLSSILMFAFSSFAPTLFPLFFYCLCAFIGVLSGIEIPLLIRILNSGKETSDEVSNVLAIDYVGALAGAILFPLVALPLLGLSRASLIFGILNFLVAGVGIYLLKRKERTGVTIRFTVALFMLVLGFFFSNNLISFFENSLYQDNITYSKQTIYQKIVVTRWKDDVRLYLNGNLQFCSIDEARYHESLVIPALESVPNPKRILILGGGDGMVARELLNYKTVEDIDLVDIDPEIIRISIERPEIAQLNQHSLENTKVHIYNEDAMLFLSESKQFYDAIIIDLPDPNNDSMSKLYSDSFYALCFRRLSQQGVLVTQATSPYYARDAFWCIEKTIRHALNSSELTSIKTYPYHVNVPSFGEWGFVLASRHTIDPQNSTPHNNTRFLTKERVYSMFAFGKDISKPEKIQVNTLENPKLFHYYQKGWQFFNQ